MLICPKCRTHYADDTLKYCLQDGAVLAAAPIAETPTVVLGETETVVSSRGQEHTRMPAGNDWAQGQATRAATLQTETRRSNTGLAVLLTAIGMLAIFGVVGIGAWLYLKNGQGEAPKNDNSRPDSGRNLNSKTTSSPANTPARANTATPAPGSPPAINTEEIKRDVAKTIMTWRSMAESRDVDSYMGNYADTVDYYLKKGASRSFVRADKQRAFSMFDSIKSDITNMDIKVDPSGDEATVTFDKEWDFSGAKRSTGKVRQEMKLKNYNGDWLITSERDLKLYYKN